MNKNLHTSTLWLIAIIIFTVAAIFTSQGVVTGDDMGYMFADSRLHAGDGVRVTGLQMIASTQASHFMGFNGRIIVHSITQLMLMPGMRVTYILVNALAVCLLWLLCLKLAYGKSRISPPAGAGMISLLWWLMPAPGVIWFSLAAFAVNYLWGALPALWLMTGINRILCDRKYRIWPWAVLAVFTGMVQESFSLPLLVGIAIMWLTTKRRELMWIALALLAGSALLLLAPGNYAHAAIGGGFAPSVLMHKMSSMCADMIRTPLPLLCIIYMLALLRRSRPFVSPDNTEKLMLISIACSLLLCCLTYTSLRQLSFPSLLACVLIARIGMRLASGFTRRVRITAAIIMSALTIILWICSFSIRDNTLSRMRTVERLATAGRTLIMIDCAGAPYNGIAAHWPLNRMDDDPFANDLLHIVFDSNTRKGLRRIYNRAGALAPLPEIIPVSLDSMRRAAAHLCVRDTLGRFKPRRLDNKYSLIVMPPIHKLPELKYPDSTHMPFASMRIGDTLCLIVPADAEVVLSVPRKKRKSDNTHTIRSSAPHNEMLHSPCDNAVKHSQNP